MNPGGTPTVLPSAVGLLEGAIGYTLGSLLLVRRGHLHRPTPCTGWDLERLLDHMNDALLALHEAAVDQQVTVGPVTVTPDLPVLQTATLRARGCQLLGDWSGLREDDLVRVDDRSVPSSVVAVAGALEVVVHGWDVAEACGQRRQLPPRLAAELLDLAPMLVSPADRGRRFAEPVEVGPDAGPGDRLLAFTGRDPR